MGGETTLLHLSHSCQTCSFFVVALKNIVEIEREREIKSESDDEKERIK